MIFLSTILFSIFFEYSLHDTYGPNGCVFKFNTRVIIDFYVMNIIGKKKVLK